MSAEHDEDEDERLEPTFDFMLNRFGEALEALGELLSLVSPHVQMLDSPDAVFSDFRRAILLVPPNRRRLLADTAAELRIDDENNENHFADVVDLLVERLGAEPWLIELVAAMNGIYRRTQRTQYYQRSVVVAGVGAFEVLVGEVVAAHYRLFPGTMADVEFTLEDLEALGSIEEAREIAIAKRVDAFLIGSMRKWSDWFKKTLGFSFEEIAISWPDLVEFWERRHVIVHAGGFASRQYLANLVDTPPDPVVLGDALVVDEEYVQAGLDQLFVVGTLLVVLTWIKLYGDEADEAVETLIARIYELLKAGRYRATCALVEAGLKLRLGTSDRLLVQVNGWIARSRCGDESARLELEAWDTDTLSPRFPLAQAVLLGDLDSAFEILPTALAAGDVDEEALYDWPLLDDLRLDKRFRDLILDRPIDDDRLSELVPVHGRVVTAGRSAKTFHRIDCSRNVTNPVRLLEAGARSIGLRPCTTCRPTYYGFEDDDSSSESDDALPSSSSGNTP